MAFDLDTMKRNSIAYLLLTVVTLIAACSDTSHGSPADGAQSFTFSGTLTNYQADSIHLYDIIGQNYLPLAGAKVDNGKFELTGTVPSAGLYFLGEVGENVVGTLVFVTDKKKVDLTADGGNFGTTIRFASSTLNQDLQTFLNRTRELQTQNQQASQQYQQAAQANPTQAEGLRKKVDSLFNTQAAYHKATMERKDLLGTYAGLYYFQPYEQASAEDQKLGQVEYFAQRFFTTTPLTNPVAGYMPMYYQRVRSYVTTLMTAYGYGAEKMTEALKPLTAQLPKGSRNHEMFLLGAIDGSVDQQVQRYNPEFTEVYFQLATQFVEAFPKSPYVASMKANIEQISKMVRVGNVAPEIVEKSPDGTEYKLSSLKGKVVLIDFWASWCGPCRKENPNVVAMYERLKSQGFEIFSVSLDRDKAAWQNAITQDKLTWPYHVSDLGFWQSKHAKAYNVSSIPSTFLLDREGKVVAVGLRGPQLEAKVKELLEKK